MNMHLNSFNPYANASGISIEAIHLKPSQGFKLCALAALMVAILYGAAMPISWPGLCAISYLVALVVVYRVVQSRAIHTVRKQINGFFTLQSHQKMLQNMVLQDESLSTPLVCVLYFKPSTGGRTVSVFIWRDSVPADLFRRLRGWLHWCAS